MSIAVPDHPDQAVLYGVCVMTNSTLKIGTTPNDLPTLSRGLRNFWT